MSRTVRTPLDPGYLRDLFSHSARYYDPVNRLTSFGRVSTWRTEAVSLARILPDDRVLDAFCGPGGLAERVLPLLGRSGELVLVDLSPVMLHEARRRISAHGRAALITRSQGRPALEFVAGDLLRQDLGLGTFDVVLLGWGLRYVPDVEAALVVLRELLRPGGRLVVLEFTRPATWSWATPAHVYFQYILPAVAGRLAGDRELHEYLYRSSASFMDGATLCGVARDAGFDVLVMRGRLGGLVTTILAERLEE